jgi:NTP pyrophosphatase (non-canonical NTP hydrolase)
MILADYQKFTESIAIYPGHSTGNEQALSYVALGLAGESGEVADKIKKYLRDGALDHLAVAKELGDVFWYATQLAYELGFTVEQILQINIDKLTSRKERGVLQGSGDNR